MITVDKVKIVYFCGTDYDWSEYMSMLLFKGNKQINKKINK